MSVYCLNDSDRRLTVYTPPPAVDTDSAQPYVKATATLHRDSGGLRRFRLN